MKNSKRKNLSSFLYTVLILSSLLVSFSYKDVTANSDQSFAYSLSDNNTKTLFVTKVYYNKLNYTYDILAYELGTTNSYDIVLSHSYSEDLDTTKTLNENYYHKTLIALVDDFNNITNYRVDTSLN